MGKDASSQKMTCRPRLLLLFPFLVVGLGMIIGLGLVAVGLLLPPPSPIDPLQIQSEPWKVATGTQLTIQSTSPRPGQAISLTLLAPGPGLPQIESLPSEYFGLAGVQIPWLLPEYRRTEIALAAAAGARTIGLDFDWRRIEPERGRYAWDDIDEAVALAKEVDLRLVPMLLYTPPWASTARYAPLDSHHAPPADYAAYRDFVYAAVDRYKPYGASPLTAGGYGISDWVIWNEPNLRTPGEAPEPDDFWTGSLEEYLLLLRAGYEGARAADPNCNVLNGGLTDIPWSGEAQYLAKALERFYDPNGDGDASDGARPFFDTLNLHLYQAASPDPAWYERRLEAVLEVMERFGDGGKPVWITETGYGSVPAPDPDSPYVDEATQAQAVPLIYRATSAYPQVERVLWWSLRDYHHNASAANSAMESHYGLLRASFEPKPAYLAYGRLTGRVGEVLTLKATTGEDGLAQVQVPASFITRPGRYLVFASAEGAPVAVLATCEALAGTGGED